MTETPDIDDSRSDGTQKRLMSAAAAMLCSTAERERAANAVGAAMGEGRLPIEEADERLERAYAARYRHELDALVADIPPPERAGWTVIARLAREQFALDAGRLLGPPGSRRLRIAILVAGVLLVTMLALALLHGVLDEGPHVAGGQD